MASAIQALTINVPHGAHTTVPSGAYFPSSVLKLVAHIGHACIRIAATLRLPFPGEGCRTVTSTSVLVKGNEGAILPEASVTALKHGWVLGRRGRLCVSGISAGGFAELLFGVTNAGPWQKVRR